MSTDLSSLWKGLSVAETPVIETNMAGSSRCELASVLIGITNSLDPQIIFTQRAKHMTTHSGQVAFPGGRWERGDRTLVDTALRESEEEIALSRDSVRVRGRLPERKSLHGLTVYPYIAEVTEPLSLKANPLEIDSIFYVPLSFLLESDPDRIDKVERHGVKYQMPAWHYEGYEIWGLTAVFLQDLLNLLDPDSSWHSLHP